MDPLIVGRRTPCAAPFPVGRGGGMDPLIVGRRTPCAAPPGSGTVGTCGGAPVAEGAKAGAGGIGAVWTALIPVVEG
ncbi:hypothetical protein [Chondromyces crocatus]|nr:hypothetical protein [Chondromyces crocatus]